ncbi:ATP-binding protein [Paenibacillus sp. FSL K6-2524]|uniref:ATP-binding protein n=1 Tax=Paenibacillus sp. FSL K6-2524 TaxID=2954516 RepID=UPI0030F7F156
MSIKTKLSLIMSVFALVILSLNIGLSYFSTRDNLRKDSESNMMLTGKQIALAVEQSRSVYDYVKRQFNEDINNALIMSTLSLASPGRIAEESLKSNENLLEITGMSLGSQSHVNILFGTNSYGNDSDLGSVRKALETRTSFLNDTHINGQHVLVSFIPIMPYQSESYVIRIISSYEPISSAISKVVWSQVSTSIVLLQIVVFASYILAGELTRPIHDILNRVNQLASGDFEDRLQVKSKDELGLLALRINAMARSLGRNTMELHRKNEENRAMKEHLESIINQTADAIHLTDLDGKIIRVNSAFEYLYGWTGEEVVGSRLDFIPSSPGEYRREWRKELELGRHFVLSEAVRICKDGSKINVSMSESPIFDEDGKITAVISISRDMTEHNKMEELLRRSEKLTMVGQLAAGVAHEIRNPLTTLRGFLQMQQRAKAINMSHTDLMLSELDRINLIVSEFLILAKPQAVHFQVKDVRFTLGDVISLLDSEAHLHNIEFEVHFPQDSVLVHCEENQLKQVFINVLKNAMEAMPVGGRITLRLDSDCPKHAVITVTDEGVGISKERLKKIGEPFYTNKEKGTGLGIMITQRIIEAHQGTLVIESEIGQGTVVTVTLPRIHAEAEQGNIGDNDIVG